MGTTNLDHIKTRLQKLMNLYEGAKKINSEGEARNAALAIQRLLLKYNLKMSDISSESDDKKNGISENVMSWYRYKSIGGEWEYKLMFVICKWNFCKAFKYGRTSDKRMIIFGKEENMNTVKWLYDMLCDRFVAFGKKRFKEYQATEDYQIKPIGLDTYLRRYLEGCAVGLEVKFEEEVESQKKDEDLSSKVTTLVVRNGAAIDDYIKNKFGGYSKGRASRSAKQDSCYRYGFKDGRNTQINKPLEGNSSAKLE